MRELVSRKREIEAMSREDMVAELMKFEMNPETNVIAGMDIHPESRLAALGKSPDESVMADIRSNPAWFNVLAVLIFVMVLVFMNM